MKVTNAVEWAYTVTPEQFSGIGQSEMQVLKYGAPVINKSKKASGLFFLMLLGIVSSITGISLFLNPGAIFAEPEQRMARSLYNRFDFSASLKEGLVFWSFFISITVLLLLFLIWWRNYKSQEKLFIFYGVGVALCAGGTIYLSSNENLTTLPIASIWIALLLGILLAIIIFLSPKQRQLLKSEHRTAAPITYEEIAELPFEHLQALLDERKQVIEILASRGLLSGIDIAEIDRQPLGALSASELTDSKSSEL
ncbi:hypothetical protein [Candidatus Enterococcus willemsii]|uniref:Uncharacterized protein n=1 Tax=Candidatus Enterococcus willemsii TaxID=1857215 RepID=A0ABQ6Z282_9ENTE|nr:hypothetical protein [Enterococcus sp. CU12B]KAF1305167.1 hypothetical protein BAU17_13910 [Enterococcus sp. CU12B]